MENISNFAKFFINFFVYIYASYPHFQVMGKIKISEIKGVWTSKEVEDLKSWMKKEGHDEIVKSQEIAEKQSEDINSITHVDTAELKVSFTFNM